MNPSSGFESVDGMNPNFEFSSAATPKSAGSGKASFSPVSGSPRARYVRNRRSLSSRSMSMSETREIKLGFNPLRSISDNLTEISSGLNFDGSGCESQEAVNKNDVFNLRVTSKVEEAGSALIDEIRKLRVDSQRAKILNTTMSASFGGIQQLTKDIDTGLLSKTSESSAVLDRFDGNQETSLSHSGGHNVNRLSGAISTSKVPNDLKSDSNNCGQSFVFGTTSTSDFVFGSNRKNNDSISSGISNVFPQSIVNVNKVDSYKSNGDQKQASVNNSSQSFATASSTDGRINPLVLDELDGKFGGASEHSINNLKLDSSCSSLRKGPCQNWGDEDSRKLNYPEFNREQEKNLSGPQISRDQPIEGSELHQACISSTSCSPSTSHHLQRIADEFHVSRMDGTEKKEAFDFSSQHGGSLKMQHVEFRTTAPKGNLSTGSKKKKHGAKKGSIKGNPSRGRKENAKEFMPVLTNNFPDNPGLSKSSSGMDVSSYQGTEDDKQSSRVSSFASDNEIKINEGNHVKLDEAEKQVSECSVSTNLAKTGPLKISEFGIESFKSTSENLDRNGENKADSKTDVQNCDRIQHLLSSTSTSSGGLSFTFAASTSALGQAHTAMRHIKKTNRMKVGRDASIPPKITVMYDALSLLQSSPVPRLSEERGQEDGAATTLQKEGHSPKIASPVSKMVSHDILKDSKKDTTSPSEACEKWRLRGNQAYANGNLEKAEDYYTQGLSCIPQNETSRDCLRALVLCYSNRAATRMSRGRIREALEDCLVAAEIDPNFFRVQLRAANCYLAIGEVNNASRHFKKLLQSTDLCVERKLILEASDGLQRAQKVSDCMDRSAELLQQRTMDEAESALSIITEALVISPYSEQLLERKAEALFMLRRYEEVIHVCEQSLEAAEKNSTPLIADGQSPNLDPSEILTSYSFLIWRYCLIFKSNFCFGKLEKALEFLEKQEHWRSMANKFGKETLEPLIPHLSTVRELIHHKSTGTEAFEAGRHAEAVECYTAALVLNVESHPFASMCFIGRAAAYQALGQIIDAIADCSLAIALDGNCMKAISTRATLFEMVRDYERAAKDLQSIVSLLTKQAEEKGNQFGASSPMGLALELKQARHRFYQMQEQASKGIPLNFYLILGVEPSVTAADLRKAYRKAALKHHPDKAGQLLARSENGEGMLQKEIAEKVHEDTDKVFKMIAQAYAVLSDPTKRSQYDIEEQKRNGQRRSGGSSTSRIYTDSRSSSGERSGRSGRQWQEPWGSSNSHARGSEATRSNRYYY